MMIRTNDVSSDAHAMPDNPSFAVVQDREQVQYAAEEWIDPRLLRPHPRQEGIYGAEESQELIEAIRASQQIKPLLITPHNVLLSGHRRWQAAMALGWQRVPVQRCVCKDILEEMEILLRENAYRQKTRVQRVREAEVWKEVETAKAALRQRAALNQGKQQPVRANLPAQEAGRTRALLARRSELGSERTYEKAAQVVALADHLTAQGKPLQAQTVLNVLNEQSVDAAARILTLTDDEQQTVLEMLATGQAQKVQTAVLAVKKARAYAQAQALPDKPRVTLASWESWLVRQPPCDLLFTDPPYATDVQDIDAFARAWLPCALSSVKATGRAFVCIGSYPAELHAYLHLDQTGGLPLPLLEVLVWTYTNTLGPQPKRGYKRNWQAILHFAGPDAPDLECPLLTEGFSVLTIPAPDGRLGERLHLWQKPEALAERFIRHASLPGARVYDPFCGTGTFVLVAHRLGRVASGCDHDPQMLNLARQRGCAVDEEVLQHMDLLSPGTTRSEKFHIEEEFASQYDCVET